MCVVLGIHRLETELEMSAVEEGRGGQPQRQASNEPGVLKSFLAGGVGGVCLVVTGHPLDTIKVSVYL